VHSSLEINEYLVKDNPYPPIQRATLLPYPTPHMNEVQWGGVGGGIGEGGGVTLQYIIYRYVMIACA